MVKKIKKNRTIQKYKVRNWSKYNQALVNRADLTFWIHEGISKTWFNKKHSNRGRPCVYSDQAIELCLTIKMIFHLPLRQTQGFMKSFLAHIDCSLTVPDYTQLYRRAKKLNISIASKLKKGEKIHLLVDSTGLKVYGDGEWKVKMHGTSKRRTWKKLHLCVDDHSLNIIDADLTEKKTHDAKIAIKFIKNVKKNKKYKMLSFKADGAYDTYELYHHMIMNKINPIIPPRKTAKTLKEKFMNAPFKDSKRDKTIQSVRKLNMEKWKEISGYHRRSRVETAMYRYKQIMGDKLMARNKENQKTEYRIACNILNKMASLGLPEKIKT